MGPGTLHRTPEPPSPGPGQLQGSGKWQKPLGSLLRVAQLLHPRLAPWCLDPLTHWSVILEAGVRSWAPDRIQSPHTWGEGLSWLPAPRSRRWSLRGCQGLQRRAPHPSRHQVMPGSCLPWAVWEPSAAECAGHGRSVSGGLHACSHARLRAPGGLRCVHPAPGWALLPPGTSDGAERWSACWGPSSRRTCGQLPALLGPALPPIRDLGPCHQPPGVSLNPRCRLSGRASPGPLRGQDAGLRPAGRTDLVW